MSAYVQVKVAVTSADMVAKALGRLGFKRVETHDVPVPLYGYRGDQREQKAHVVVRAANVWGSANDIGFERLPDGTWVSHVSAFDRRVSGGQSQRFRGGFDAAFAQAYNVETAASALTAEGWNYTEETDTATGEVLLVAERWT